MKATSAESEVRLLLSAGQTEGLVAYVIFRPVGSNQAVVKILSQLFTIDASRRLVNAGVRLDSSQRKSILRGKTQQQITDYFNSFPQLDSRDFPLLPRKPKQEN